MSGIDLYGIPLSEGAVPRLEFFEGNPVDCITICDGKRPINSLLLTLRAPHYDLRKSSSSRERGGLLNANPDVAINDIDKDVLRHLTMSSKTLSTLRLRPVSDHILENLDDFEKHSMSASAIKRLAAACPNVRLLEVSIASGIVSPLVSHRCRYLILTLVCQLFYSNAFNFFKKLEILELFIWTDVPRHDPMTKTLLEMDDQFYLTRSSRYRSAYGSDSDDFDDPYGDYMYEDELPPAVASEYFPSSCIGRDIEKYLASKLPKLFLVKVDIAGNKDPDEEYFNESDGPDFEVGYTFSIIRRDGEVTADLIEEDGELVVECSQVDL